MFGEEEPRGDQALATHSGPQPWGEAPRAEGVSSPRECEVLSQVAEGHSSKATAAILFVSPKTVKTHVDSILHKMPADSRVQLAATAARYEASGSLARTVCRHGSDARVHS